MKRFLLLIVLSMLLLSACAPKSTFQYEWPTPVATFTPVSGVVPPTPTPLFECIAWHAASKYVGQSQCVEGGVLRVDKSEGASLVIFSKESNTFCGVSDLDLSDLVGKCVRIVGTIEDYKGRRSVLSPAAPDCRRGGLATCVPATVYWRR